MLHAHLPKFFDPEADLERLGACLCGAWEFTPICHEQGLTVERCERCGLVRTNPRLKQSAILRAYETGAQRANQGERFFSGELLKAGKTAERRFRWRDVTRRYESMARDLRERFPSSEKPALLEVGFGDGRFLGVLKESGFQVHGFDISETAVERLRTQGLPATYASSLEEACYRSRSFDVVVTWEVVEHLPDPIRFAREVHRILKPGCFWFIQVPNWRWNSLKLWLTRHIPGRKDYLSFYGVLLPLFHLYHYTLATLRGVVEPQGFIHLESFRPRLWDERNWPTLLGHEAFYWADTLPAVVSRNRRHHNVVLVELFQASKKR